MRIKKHKKNTEEPILIPIKLESYEDLFNKIHNVELNKRKIDADVDELIKTIYFKIADIKYRNATLVITLPKDVRSTEKEYLSKEGLIYNYKDFTNHEKKIKYLGSLRLLYYILISLLLLSCWYFVRKNFGDSIITALLNSGGIVVLWQVMTLVLIENKNLKRNSELHKRLSEMEITFLYK